MKQFFTIFLTLVLLFFYQYFLIKEYMFQEVTIIFLSPNINLYPSYKQFCQGQKRRCAVFAAAQDWIIGNQKFQRNSLVNCTSVDEGFSKISIFY